MHGYIAGVMGVVLAFVLAFGHRLNDVLTHSLATRYENARSHRRAEGAARARRSRPRAAAEAANRAKSQLLAAASHDLRQPLHALGAVRRRRSPRARATPTGAAGRQRAGARRRASTAQFDQLLDLSRLEAGALHPQRERVPLGAAVRRGSRAEFAPSGGVARPRAAFVATRARRSTRDAALLERIAAQPHRQCAALHASRRRGRRRAAPRPRRRHRRRRHAASASPPRDRERIFDEFFQVPRAHAPPRGRGMGLGLAIVRRFADAARARVELRIAARRAARASASSCPARRRRAPRAGAHRRIARAGRQRRSTARWSR